jgi:hypothetical protein
MSPKTDGNPEDAGSNNTNRTVPQKPEFTDEGGRRGVKIRDSEIRQEIMCGVGTNFEPKTPPPPLTRPASVTLNASQCPSICCRLKKGLETVRPNITYFFSQIGRLFFR